MRKLLFLLNISKEVLPIGDSSKKYLISVYIYIFLSKLLNVF